MLFAKIIPFHRTKSGVFQGHKSTELNGKRHEIC